MPTPHLILWTCGPVQEFIAAARKGRDLWFGSWLLSEVSTAAAAVFDANGQLLLPAPADPDELARPDFDVPNRVLAKVHTDDPRALAEEASERARARLLDLATATFDLLDPRSTAPIYDRDAAVSQIVDLLETSWAAVRSTDDPRRDRLRVLALLEARKSARLFDPPTFAEAGVAKSSLDGHREAVTRVRAGMRLGLTNNERLCGVGLLKRHGYQVAPRGAPGGQITSVSTFAVHTWLRPALGDQGEHREVVEAAIQTFGNTMRSTDLFGDFGQPWAPLLGTVDAHMFFRSRLHEFVTDDERLNDALTHHSGAIAAFVHAIEEATGVRLRTTPNPYYAVLLGDGDRIGTYLQPLDDRELTSVSRALSGFANRVRREVFELDRLRGMCVYAGGDDVLAFLPVDVALEQARALSDAFSEELDEVHATIANPASRPTFSAGICVAHHLSPLRDVLAAARDAEKIAKDDAGRDAWAVRLAMRSGSTLDVHGSWGDGSDRALTRLTALSTAKGPLPRGMAHELSDAATRLGPGVPELERCELRRVFAQKPLQDEPPDWVRALFSEELRRGLSYRQCVEALLSAELQRVRAYREGIEAGKAEPKPVNALDGFADRLVLARTLAGMEGAA